jgi:hypothetical protein
MGWQIIKQPNGKYCIFSSVVDNVVYYDGTPEQILEAIIEAETTPIRRKVNETISQLDKGEKPYHQFTKSFDEMIKLIERVHGKKEAQKVLNKLK